MLSTTGLDDDVAGKKNRERRNNIMHLLSYLILCIVFLNAK